MWRLLLLISILPVVAAVAASGWFGLRALAREGKRTCRVNPTRWKDTLGTATPEVSPLSADAAGAAIREAALAEWRQGDPKVAGAREGARRFGQAVPPLTAMVAVFAALLAKVPVIGAFAIFVGALALACLFGFLSLGSELRAVARTVRRVRDAHVFPRTDDEDAAAACAAAHAWRLALPPVLRWVHPQRP